MSMNVSTFQSAAQGASTKTLSENGAGQTILCDVNGTLLLIENNIPKINAPLVEFLLAAEDRGYQVQLHSMANQELLQFKLLGRRTPVWAEYMARRDAKGDDLFIAKGDIPTKDAILTIDDEHDSAFTSQAPNQWHPSDGNIAATMVAWGAVKTAAASAPTGPAGGPK